jgi:hypothetical protein
MKFLYRCCAGLDIHRDTVSACIRRRVRRQAEAAIEEEVFGSFTQDLERLRNWLKQHRVRQVAMESTGVYWIPVWNGLERVSRFTLTLVNPATVRALQGHKTDRIDARRIAEYLQYGLLRGSFIPPRPIRHLRELTRHACAHPTRSQSGGQPHRTAAGNGEPEAGLNRFQHCGHEWDGDVALAGQRRTQSGAFGRVRTGPDAY